MPPADQAKSLRYLINLRLALTSLFVLILSVLIVILQARASVKNELESSLNLAAQLILLNSPSQNRHIDNVNMDVWLSRFVSLEQSRHLLIELQQPGGLVSSFSAQAKKSDKTKAPALFVHLFPSELPNIQQPVTLKDGRQANIVIKADPIDEITEAWQESQSLFLILLTLTGFMFLIVNLLFKKSFYAINRIIGNLKAIESGYFHNKLPGFSILEYDQIAEAINHLNSAMLTSQQENRALTRHTLKIQEEERQHLAKELHDELGQSLTAIKVMAASANNNQADISQITHTIISICDHLIDVVRSMMRNLHPLVLTELGLKASLEDLLQQWSHRQPELDLLLHCPDDIDDLLPSEISIQLFRICQEGLTNIVRHAEATSATIEMNRFAQKILQLTIYDNGKGCAEIDTKKSFGLLGLHERIKSMGGELEINSSPQQGFKVIATIPMV